MKKLKLFTIIFGVLVLGTTNLTANCKYDIIIKSITKNEEEKENDKLSFSLKFEKGFPDFVINVATKYIIKILNQDFKDNNIPIEIKDRYDYYVRMPVEKATIDLELFLKGKCNQRKFEYYFKDNIFTKEKFNNIIQKHLNKDKKTAETNIKKLIKEHRNNLKAQIEEYKQLLDNLEKEKTKYKEENEFYLNYGKEITYSKIARSSIVNQDINLINDNKVIPENFLDNEKEKEKIKKILNDKKALIKIGKEIYEKDIKMRKNFIKILEKREKEFKEYNEFYEKEYNKKFDDDEITKKIIEIIGKGVETTGGPYGLGRLKDRIFADSIEILENRITENKKSKKK